MKKIFFLGFGIILLVSMVIALAGNSETISGVSSAVRYLLATPDENYTNIYFNVSVKGDSYNASFCYQETATDNASCNNQGNGTYRSDHEGFGLYINYSMPLSILENDTLWMVGLGQGSAGMNQTNVTIPANCINLTIGVIQLNLYYFEGLTGRCLSNTGWQSILKHNEVGGGQIFGDVDNVSLRDGDWKTASNIDGDTVWLNDLGANATSSVFEEAIYWKTLNNNFYASLNISISNVSIYSNDFFINNTYSYLGNYSATLNLLTGGSFCSCYNCSIKGGSCLIPVYLSFGGNRTLFYNSTQKLYLSIPSLYLSPINTSAFLSSSDILINTTIINFSNIINASLWTNSTGTWAVNSIQSITNNSINFTLNLSEGFFNYAIEVCNDGDDCIFTDRYLLNSDSPSVYTINQPSNSTSLSLTINITIEDNTLLSSCFYNVTRGASTEISNTALNISQYPQLIATNTVSSVANYVFNIWCNNSNNFNSSSSKAFSITSSGGTSPPPSSGGGGSTAPKTTPVIGLQEIISTQKYTDLQKAIFFSTINTFCSSRISGQALAIADYSDECSLSTDDLSDVYNRLQTYYNIYVNAEDLRKFYDQYKNKKYFQFYATQTEIDKYDLFTSVLGLTTLLEFTPPSVAKTILINNPNSQSYTIKFKIASNKPLKSCEVLSDNENVLNCSVGGSIILIEYHLKDTDFLSDIFSGLINVQTEAKQNELESKRIPITFTVYNYGYEINGIPVWIIFIVIVVLIIMGIYLFIKFLPKKKKSKFIEQFKIS